MSSRGQQDVSGFAAATTEGRLQCRVCQRRCVLADGETGFCRVRIHRAQRIVPLTYGRVAALHWAEVERKPLFHFYPGRIMLSVGSLGCNFRCPGCQNWLLAHADIKSAIAETEFISPQKLVELAVEHKALGLSWTYNEPSVWFEYTLEGAKLAKARGLLTNYVTNGSLSVDALDAIGPYLDAYRVDIKAFSEGTYPRVANFQDYRGILEVAERAKHRWGMHVECVTNVVPTLNDGEDELRRLAGWIANSLGRETPWHVTRFVPQFKLSGLPATPVATLEQAQRIGLAEGLRFVYIGNVLGHPAEDTYCPECSIVLIQRSGSGPPRVALRGAACPGCGYRLPGRFE